MSKEVRESQDIFCEAHKNVDAPCCPVCLMQEVETLRAAIQAVNEMREVGEGGGEPDVRLPDVETCFAPARTRAVSERESDLMAAKDALDLWETVRDDLARGDFHLVDQWVQNDGALTPISEALEAIVEVCEDRLRESD